MGFDYFIFSIILFWKNIHLLLLYPKHVIKLLWYNLGCYTLAQMPSYVIFMKVIMSNKKMLEAYGIMNFFENCSIIIQRKVLEKLKDPGGFTIPCIIGEHTFNKALCDLGASINLMPFSKAKKLNLGKSHLLLYHFKWRIDR